MEIEMDVYRKSRRVAVLAPVAWRTPPRQYGAWETVAGNITEGLVRRGWDVTLFATGDSVTQAALHAVIEGGYEENPHLDPKVVEVLHISEMMERAGDFDLIHNNYDFMPLTFSRLIDTPMLTTIHGFSSPKILSVYRKYNKDCYYTSISDSDRDSELDYLATVYNGIDLSQLTVSDKRGDKLVFLGRIHPDKGVHLAIEVAQKAEMEILIAGIVQDQEYFNDLVRPHLNDSTVQYIGPVGPVQRDKLFKDALAVLHLNVLAERFGLVMAEANGAGVPVIAMDNGSCREVIEHEKTGFLVQDTGQAVKRLEHIDRILPKDCRERVERMFSIDSMVEAYERVYAEIFEIEKS